jgi:hypothetical protein
MSEDDGAVDGGVRVVGAPGAQGAAPTPEKAQSPEDADDGQGGVPTQGRVAGDALDQGPRRGLFIGIAALAVLGMVGTITFGLLWAGSSSSGQTDPAMVSSARSFLIDLTNFNAKSVDRDFSSITAMATGTFSTQANKFFNSSIRSELESALAESRGQIRNLYVQTDNGSQASVYAVVDQVYVNNKISTPQSDVLRVVVNLQKVGSTWKISDVTVLEGATPASTGSPSGSAGSSVPGQ